LFKAPSPIIKGLETQRIDGREIGAEVRKNWVWEMGQLMGWGAALPSQNMEITPLWDIVSFCDIGNREKSGPHST